MKVLRDLSPHPKGQGKAQSFPAVCHGLQKSPKPFPGWKRFRTLVDLSGRWIGSGQGRWGLHSSSLSSALKYSLRQTSLAFRRFYRIARAFPICDSLERVGGRIRSFAKTRWKTRIVLGELRELKEWRSGPGCRGLARFIFCGRSGTPAILTASDFLFGDSGFPFFHQARWSSVPPCGKDFWWWFCWAFNHC